MKRLLAILALALLLSACDPEGSGHQPERAPKPPAGNHGGPGQDAQQPAPVQGDPSAHNKQEGELDLHVEWVSENGKSPACEWSGPRGNQPCANMERSVQDEPGDDYIGMWEHGERGKPGETYSLLAQGNIGTKSIECSYWWKGAYHSLPSSGKRCGGQFTLS